MRSYERPTLVSVGEFELNTQGSGGYHWEWIDAWGWGA
jgi:hypothetical protein